MSGSAGDKLGSWEGSSVSGTNGFKRAVAGAVGCFKDGESALRATRPKATAVAAPAAVAVRVLGQVAECAVDTNRPKLLVRLITKAKPKSAMAETQAPLRRT